MPRRRSHVGLVAAEVDAQRQRHRDQAGVLAGEEHGHEVGRGLGDDRHPVAAPDAAGAAPAGPPGRSRGGAAPDRAAPPRARRAASRSSARSRPGRRSRARHQRGETVDPERQARRWSWAWARSSRSTASILLIQTRQIPFSPRGRPRRIELRVGYPAHHSRSVTDSCAPREPTAKPRGSQRAFRAACRISPPDDAYLSHSDWAAGGFGNSRGDRPRLRHPTRCA